jgi:hypothetical protein
MCLVIYSFEYHTLKIIIDLYEVLLQNIND